MIYIQELYASRGIDISDMSPVYVQTDLTELTGTSQTSYLTFLDEGSRLILITPKFNKELEEKIHDNNVDVYSKRTLLHEMSHHKQNEANALLDAIKDKLNFKISAKKYTEGCSRRLCLYTYVSLRNLTIS